MLLKVIAILWHASVFISVESKVHIVEIERALCISVSFHMERSNLKQWLSVFDHMLSQMMEKKLWSVHLCHTIFDTPKPLQFYLQIQIRKWKTDGLWQSEVHYVCSDPSSNENRMIPNRGMVPKLKSLIWNCQDRSVQNRVLFESFI